MSANVPPPPHDRHRLAGPLARLALVLALLAAPLVALGWVVFDFEVAVATFATVLTLAAGATSARLALGDPP